MPLSESKKSRQKGAQAKAAEHEEEENPNVATQLGDRAKLVFAVLEHSQAARH